MVIPILVVLAILVIGAITLVIIGARRSTSTDDLLNDRLADFIQRGETVDLEKMELSLPFSERVLYPIARKFGEFAARITPQNQINSLSRKLEMAGSPAGLDPTVFMTLQFVSAAIFGGIVFAAVSFSTAGWATSTKILLTAVVCLVGYFFPSLWLTSQINKRQKSVRKALPDALDLLTICVEAGLGFDASMLKVSEKWESELSLAFARVIQEVQLGKVRREAMRDMADRIGLPELTSFVAAVIQSESLGVSLAKVLRIQSEQMRIKRRQMAEEEAHKVPIKMMIPMALLIFPSLVIVLMTPAGLQLIHSPLFDMLN